MHNTVKFGWTRLASLGHPSKFQRVSRLIFAIWSTAFNGGRQVHSAGRPSRWATGSSFATVITCGDLHQSFTDALLWYNIVYNEHHCYQTQICYTLVHCRNTNKDMQNAIDYRSLCGSTCDPNCSLWSSVWGSAMSPGGQTPPTQHKSSTVGIMWGRRRDGEASGVLLECRWVGPYNTLDANKGADGDENREG